MPKVKDNADNDEFHSDKPTGSGPDAVLGGQVTPETQTSEVDGARTYANPVPDPGPAANKGYTHPTKSGQNIGDVNEPLIVRQRTSTAPDHHNPNNVTETTLPPEVMGGGAASDVYNPEKGRGLTDMAQRDATKGRELAPTKD